MTEQERAAEMAEEVRYFGTCVNSPDCIHEAFDEADQAVIRAALCAYARKPPPDLREAIIKAISGTHPRGVAVSIGEELSDHSIGAIADAIHSLLPQTQAASELTRPIVGIENRTAQEVFDIMRDRIRLDRAAGKEG